MLAGFVLLALIQLLCGDEFDRCLIFDREQYRYQVIDIGWSNNRRVYDCSLHLDIINGKIWVQQNMTKMQIGHVLMSKGVAQADIVLGFQAPYAREYSGFAIG